MRKLIATGAIALAALASGAVAIAAGTTPHPPERKWHFSGPFGTFDRASAQRGYQIYAEVCAACHSLQLLAYHVAVMRGCDVDMPRNLAKSVTVE